MPKFGHTPYDISNLPLTNESKIGLVKNFPLNTKTALAIGRLFNRL